MVLPFQVGPSDQFFAQYGIEIDTKYFPFLQLRIAVIGCVLYLISDLLFQPPLQSQSDKADKVTKQASSKGCGTMKIFMFVHNMGLCIFSFLCFINTVPIAWELWNHPQGWSYALSEGWSKQFTEGTFGLWAYFFYLSKFYEFIDTWIVIARGRRPIFLQVFHHIGAVMGMWLGMVIGSTGTYIFVIANTFIHTIMYFYYAMSVLKIKLPFKRVITMMQMIQFIVGNSIVILQMYIYSDLISGIDKFCCWYHVIYTSILFILFNAFFKKAYKKGNNKNKIEIKKIE